VRRAFDTLPDAMLVLDAAGRVLEANPAAETALSRTRQELIGASVRDLGSTSTHLERFEQALSRVLGKGEPYEGVVSIETPLGARDWEVRLVPDHGETSEGTSVFVVARDMTSTMRREAELQARSDELTRLGDSLCHDLRSPLVTIRSFLGFLAADLRENDESRITSDIGSIQNATDRMSELITLVFQRTRPRRHGAR
jgi:PAS domain S-box-containing protein